ncbi:MAG: hypothetical protein PVJ67_05365 [Candidatus Pacearchaeota archaeon]|jgi:hypothetical protein
MGLIKVTPDKEKSKNILEMINLIEERIKVQDKDKFSSLIISCYYEIIKELITILLLIDGYKTLSHKDLIVYLKSNYSEISSSEIMLVDNLRIVRNRISYEGTKIDFSYLENKEIKIKQIIKKLKSLVNNKLKR